MLPYILIISSEMTPPANMPNFIKNVEEESLSTFEIMGLLYTHKAIFVKPKASQINLMRSIASSSPIELVVYAPEDEAKSATFMMEVTGLPIMNNVAEIDTTYGPEEDNKDEESPTGEVEDEEEEGENSHSVMFKQG